MIMTAKALLRWLVVAVSFVAAFSATAQFFVDQIVVRPTQPSSG